MKKYYLIGIPLTFIVIFNLGYVFHDLLMGTWLHEKEAAISRESYIIPAIALAFLLYSIIQSFLLPIFYFYAKTQYNWGIFKTAIAFGALIGFLWDALQGGIIEYATFNMPIEVVFVDSGFHVVEGIYTAVILAFFYSKFNRQLLEK
ncbi:MAG: hypothetical protein OEV74_02505 [Cyclobacteriaceae bacterium]|nr:hypothetical protein [Cyclobacteriaceae bacterium]MDH4295125.1 hypothetical protein [Cyclobacteriaceae bacterium]MDH5250433.1 hypothetical protein [Cyclobacteriaceae bacterium]